MGSILTHRNEVSNQGSNPSRSAPAIDLSPAAGRRGEPVIFTAEEAPGLV
jgi:hypothetical protein